MKILALGDIHGRDCWKRIVDKEKADKIIFIGDYLDSKALIDGNAQLDNLWDIIDFKTENDDDVILLFGNHDYHYYPGQMQYSGFQPHMAVSFGQVLRDKMGLFKMVHQELLRDDVKVTFSHAGISEMWVHNNQLMKADVSLIDNINDHLQFKPSIFEITHYNPYGDHPSNSPIWIRLESLKQYGMPGVQVVGHTMQHKGIKEIIASPSLSIWPIDTLGTTLEYLVIDNGEFIVKSFEL